MENRYADIILPLAVPGTFTYEIPVSLSDQIRRGVRVVVPFGTQKLYTGVVAGLHNNQPPDLTVRAITGVFQPDYPVSDRLLDLMAWLSEYYMALPGEVLKAALPSAMLPSDKKQIEKAAVRAPEKAGKESRNRRDAVEPPAPLTPHQSEAYDKIKLTFPDNQVILLHGVTSSGKTEIYIHLIREQVLLGRQVLYMLPEIALTTQIIERLRRHFGSDIGIYHSRMSLSARLKVWNGVAAGRLNIILGVRSSLFLPFTDLGLIIVDEEHDTSYKQNDPSPRYHARDAAIMLSRIHGARTLLGSATPAIESYNNALKGKYGLVELRKRFGSVNMPDMVITDMRRRGRGTSSAGHFSPRLLTAIEDALAKGEQVMLFQNRRGFSPFLMCSECGHVPGCKDCSVSYTYHKAIDRLVCHYCGRSVHVPKTCTECGSSSMVTRGFGTEKVEEEIKILFPSAAVSRMDQDTTRGKDSHSAILSDFAEGNTQILIGTQMVSKGLDFENLTVVGILDADNMLHFPDFRSHERSFQMMEQVSGRAGRRTHTGTVIIQTADPSNIVLRQVLRHDFMAMFRTQMEERGLFSYPPFSRLIRIVLKHRDREKLNMAAERLARYLRERLGNRVLGPEHPVVMQVQRWYIKTIMVKLGDDLSASRIKEYLRKAMDAELKIPGMGGLRIHADVDPQ